MSSSLARTSFSLLSKPRSFLPLPLVSKFNSTSLNLNGSHARSKLAAPTQRPRSSSRSQNHSEFGIRSPFPVIQHPPKQRPWLMHESVKGETYCPMPRILIVSRRHLRKGKYVDFVGEYHIDLVQENGGVPILLPRTMKTTEQLEAYLLGGVDGVLVMEGNDLGASYRPYGDELELPEAVLNEVQSKHTGDVEIDDSKDTLEMSLITDKVLKEGVPYLGLCRGSQLFNVAMGGTLYFDVTAETGSTVKHIDYENYDGHRHPITVLPRTPLSGWFHEEFAAQASSSVQLNVNSYHHQGIKKLAPGLKPMCFSLDGLVEGFYHPAQFDPSNGKYHIGLQWHPERMLGDYAGCRRVYQDFVLAATVHRAHWNSHLPISKSMRWTPSLSPQQQQPLH